MNASPHILIVDDDREIRDLLTRFLDSHGFRVTTASEGRSMWNALTDWRIDLVILDVMLPGEDGFSLCRRLRAESLVPVIMLTAKGQDTERIIGLELGADDYMPKPFNPLELVTRIRAVLRRSQGDRSGTLLASGGKVRFAGWTLDLARRQLESPDAVTVDLSAGEFNLLVAFIERSQRVLSREQLLDAAPGRGAVLFDRSIDVQVSRLRQKLETDQKRPTLIKTVRGGGYVFTSKVEPV